MSLRLCLVLSIASFTLAGEEIVAAADTPAKTDVVKFARFRVNDGMKFGIVEGAVSRFLDNHLPAARRQFARRLMTGRALLANPPVALTQIDAYASATDREIGSHLAFRGYPGQGIGDRVAVNFL